MPGAARAAATALATSASMSRPAAGRTWTVTSRPTSACQSFAVLTTSIAAPVVSAARKVMMATTAASERPAIELDGTIEAEPRGARSSAPVGSMSSHGSIMVSIGLVIDMQPSFMQHQAARIELVHQGDIVGGDDDGGARLVELDEQPQQALTEIGIDVAGGLVGEQKLRPRDHRACNSRALLLAAGQDRRQRPHAVAETDPLQQFDYLRPVLGLVLADNAQRQRHVLVGGHMVEQPKILEHQADAAAQRGAAVLGQRRRILVEHGDQATGRLERQEQHAQQRGLAGARGAGEELKRLWVDAEGQVAQNLGASPIAQADIFEADHAVLRNAGAGRHPIRPSRLFSTMSGRAGWGGPAGLVSNPLTNRVLRSPKHRRPS